MIFDKENKLNNYQLGGRKAAETNKRKYGEDFYAKIGAIGGSVKTTKGFGSNKELASKAGSKGGKMSRRGKAGETRYD